MSREKPPLFGPDVVKLLLPHRPPLLLVDNVLAYETEPRLRLVAERHITANEPVFAGHFPDLGLWPGIYTIEGLGQSCNLALILEGMQQRWQQDGHDPQEVVATLQNLQRGYRQHPGFDAASAENVLGMLARDRTPRRGLAAAVNIKYVRPVFAGQLLQYEVARSHVLDRLHRFDVVARVDGAVVAKGTTTGSAALTLPVAAE